MSIAAFFRKSHGIRLPFCAAVCIFFFFSCESAIDCLNGISPAMHDKDFPQATLFTNYSQTLDVDMHNASPGGYGITAINVSGNVPPGLACTANGMAITIHGTPTLLGNFEFKINVTVGSYENYEDGSDGLCSTKTSHSYKIKVN